MPSTNTPTLIYQSEQRSIGQRWGAFLVGGGWPPAPGCVPSGGGLEEPRIDAVEGRHDLLTPADEGIVHFSLPARVSRGSEGEKGNAGSFSVALWQIVNRARRVSSYLVTTWVVCSVVLWGSFNPSNDSPSPFMEAKCCRLFYPPGEYSLYPRFYLFLPLP